MWPASLNLTWRVSCTTVYLIKCLTINNILPKETKSDMIIFNYCTKCFQGMMCFSFCVCLFLYMVTIVCLQYSLDKSHENSDFQYMFLKSPLDPDTFNWYWRTETWMFKYPIELPPSLLILSTLINMLATSNISSW